jgi:hypothetical protein
VEKVKRSFNAVLFTPGADVPAEEKISLGKEFGYKNDHERDALAAAISAFKRHKNKFQQVEKKVPAEIDPDEVKALVVKGYSIENAIAEFTEIPVPKKKPIAPPEAALVVPEMEAIRGQNRQLIEQVRTLRAYLEEIRTELQAKDAVVHDLNAKLDRLKDKTTREVKRDHEIKIREKEIERLRGLLRSERKYIKKLKKSLASWKKAERIEELKGLRRIAMLDAFTRESVVLALEQERIGKEDMVFLEDASGGGKNAADLLMERGIAAVITDSDMSPGVREHFQEGGIPVFSSRELPVLRIDGLPFVRPDDVEAARAGWAQQMKSLEAERQKERLESIIQEYRVERRKEERKKLQQGR